MQITILHKIVCDLRRNARRFAWFRLLCMPLVTLAAFQSADAQSPPASFTSTITNGGSSVTVDFTLHPVRSANFSVVVQNSSGGFDSYAAPAARTYLGTVQGYPGAIAAGTKKPDGTLLACISFENGVDWYAWGESTWTRGSPTWSKNWPGFTVPSGGAGSNVYAAEIGIDSSYEHFGLSGYNVDDNIYIIENSIVCANISYLRDAGILHRIGRIVICADQTQDPYHNISGGGGLLGEIANQWNNVLPASTHDLAAGAFHGSVGGGLAWVGTIGTGNRYSVNDSGGGDFSVYLRHEAGHNWSCSHYEGNTPEGPTIMSGNTLGRFSSPCASKVISHRNSKLGILDNLGSYGVSLPPRANLDFGVVPVDGSALLDVLANDHDANGNNISIQGYDATSSLGGTVSLSAGKLQLQGVADHGQMDWFEYQIADSTGRTGTAIVYAMGEKSSSKLTGTGIGSPGSWGNLGNTFDKALDGNLSTFFDAPNASGDWVGLDLGIGSNFAVTKVKYCPRSGFPSRMDGGQIQGSNAANFASGVVTLFTISGAPASGELTTQMLNNNTAYRYVRYLGPPNGNCDIAEIEFWGSAASAPHAPFDVTGAGTGDTQVSLGWRAPSFVTSYNVKRSTASGGPYTTIASGLTATTYTDSGLSTGTTYYYVVTAENNLGESANSAEVTGTPVTLSQLTGTVIGTPGSWGNNGNTIDKVFDGNLTTSFNGPDWSGDWAGLDLGTAKSVRQVQYCPRPGQESRMLGGVFQGAEVADFSSGVVTLGTITAVPPGGVLTTLNIPNANAFRYVRYLGPDGGYCDVAEVQFWGPGFLPPAPPAAPSALTASAAGKRKIALTWADNSNNESSFKIERSTNGVNFTQVASVGANTTGYTNTGLTSGTTYYYRVRANNANGDSAYSNTASARAN